MILVHVPTMKQRRAAMLGCGTYHPCFAYKLWRPTAATGSFSDWFYKQMPRPK